MLFSKVVLPKRASEREDKAWTIDNKKHIFIAVLVAGLLALTGIITGIYTYYVISFFVLVCGIGTKRTLEWIDFVWSITWKILVIGAVSFLIFWNCKYYTETKEAKSIMIEHMEEVLSFEYEERVRLPKYMSTNKWYRLTLVTQMIDGAKYLRSRVIEAIIDDTEGTLDEETLQLLENKVVLEEYYKTIPENYSSLFYAFAEYITITEEYDGEYVDIDKFDNTVKKEEVTMILLLAFDFILLIELLSWLFAVVFRLKKHIQRKRSVAIDVS